MVALFLLSAWLSFLSLSAASDSCSNIDTDVLVLGGGMAGVSAASRLQDLGRKFLLFEAGQNLGGRMKRSEIFPGFFTSEGPVYIHGVDPRQPNLHPIYKLMQDCGGLKGFFIGDKIIYNGTNDITPLYKTRLNSYYEACERAASLAEERQKQNLPDISLGDALRQSGWMPTTPLDNLTEWIAFDFCAAVNPNEFSLYSQILDSTYTDFLSSQSSALEEEGTNYLITDSRGYVQLPKCLASNFSNNQIQLNSRVTKIFNNKDCVCIEVTQSSGNNRYCGRYAILTFSVGVLKSEAFRSVLSPFFSQSKQQALDVFEMAHYLKTYLQFNEAFWDSNATDIARVDQLRGNYPFFTNAFVSSNINALILVLTEDLADQALTMDLQAFNDSITEALCDIYGSMATPPTQIYRESYYSDPLFLGSYVSVKVGLKNDTVSTLQSPEMSLYLAGEATSLKYPGYVHGAYQSGMRAADMVNNALVSHGTTLSNPIYMILLVCILSVTAWI